MLIGRHSFIRQSKLFDVAGRIDYISNSKRQEYLYATYQTEGATPEFWKNLARENQLDFKASGSAGKCIEGREFIIALPESFVQYRAGDVVRLFTETFHIRYGVECSTALHHNKTKTNYHIHLVFSERKMLEQPEVKIATRNMFYDEQGKHRRTKKEILDEQGNIRTGCSIIPKGEVYESHIFTKKEEWFKNKVFTKEVKELFTDTINCYVKEESEKLSVFQQGGIYLATKKIGKNNPKAEEIKADNAASDNDTAKNIGSAMQVAGAVSTVSTSIDMLSEAGSNAENMAHAYRIPIPDIKKQLIAFAVIPILIVVGTYIPQYIKGKQAMDQRIAASAKQVEIVKKALEPVCVRVHADNPNESRSRSSYTVMGYLRDSGATDCYVHVQVNNSGTITNISYVEGVDINKSLEENLMQAEKDFATLQKSFENLNVSVSNPEILSYQAIPQQFKDEFLNGTFYKSFRFYDQDAPISLSCSFDTETEDQFDEYTRPKIHFFLGSK